MTLSLLGLDGAELSVLLAGPRRMRAMNLAFRGVDKTTDVLSFPQYASRGEIPKEGLAVLGDVVICPERVREQAAEFGETFASEMRRMLVHGILHLVGYDHEAGPAESRRMKAMEARILRALSATGRAVPGKAKSGRTTCGCP